MAFLAAENKNQQLKDLPQARVSIQYLKILYIEN